MQSKANFQINAQIFPTVKLSEGKNSYGVTQRNERITVAPKRHLEDKRTLMVERLSGIRRDYFYQLKENDKKPASLVQRRDIIERTKQRLATIDFSQVDSLPDEKQRLLSFLGQVEAENCSIKNCQVTELKGKLDDLKELTDQDIHKIIAGQREALDFDTVYEAVKGTSDRLLTAGEKEASEQNQQDDEKKASTKEEQVAEGQTKAELGDMEKQIRHHLEKLGVVVTPVHEAIAKALMQGKIPLSETNCLKMDALIALRRGHIPDQKLRLALEQESQINKIDLVDLVKRQPLTKIEIVEVLERLKTGNLESLDNSDRTEQVTHVKDRSLEYIRYKMTYQAAIKLNDAGINIKALDLRRLERALIRLELPEESLEMVVADTGRSAEELTDALVRIDKAIYQVGQTPIATVAKLALSTTPSLVDFQERAVNQRNGRLAEMSYQALETSPRADMGDSLTKAFGQIDGLLREIDLEVTEDNRRAVMMLGRGQLEITVDNVLAVKQIDTELQILFERLTPTAILENQLLDKDILSMPVDQLAEQLMENQPLLDGQMDRVADSIARQLYKLDQEGQLTETSRQELVSLYRLTTAIKQSRGGAISFLLKNKLPISLDNLYEAARYLKQTHLKQSKVSADIDDTFGFLESQQEPTLKEIIRSGYYEKMRQTEEVLLQESQSHQRQEQYSSQPIEAADQEAVKEALNWFREEKMAEWTELFDLTNQPELKQVRLYHQWRHNPYFMSDALMEMERTVKSELDSPDSIDQRTTLVADIKRLLVGKTKEQGNQDDIVTAKLKALESSYYQNYRSNYTTKITAVKELTESWEWCCRLNERSNHQQVFVAQEGKIKQVALYFPNGQTSKADGTERTLFYFSFMNSQQSEVKGFLTVQETEVNCQVVAEHFSDGWLYEERLAESVQEKGFKLKEFERLGADQLRKVVDNYANKNKQEKGQKNRLKMEQKGDGQQRDDIGKQGSQTLRDQAVILAEVLVKVFR